MEISLFEPTQIDFTAQQSAPKTEASASEEFGAIIEGLMTESVAESKTGVEACDNAEAKGAEMIQTALLNSPSFDMEVVAENASNEEAVINIETLKATPADELVAEAKNEDSEAVEVVSNDEAAAAPVYVQAQAATQTITQAQTVQPRTFDGGNGDEAVEEVFVGSGKVSQSEKDTNGFNLKKDSKAAEQKAPVEPQSFNNEARIERAEVKPEGSENVRVEKGAEFKAEKVETPCEPEKNSIELSAVKESLTKEETANDGNFDSEGRDKKEAFFAETAAASGPSDEAESLESVKSEINKIEAAPFAAIERETGTQTGATSGGEGSEGRELSGVQNASHAKEAVQTKAAQELSANNNSVQHAKEVYEKFGEGVKMSLADSGKEVRLSLNPENLGHLQIKLKIEDSLVKAHILVDSAAVKSVFDTDSSRLKEVFAAQGLTLDKCSVELNMNSNRFEDNSSGGSSWDSQFNGKREQASSFWGKEEPKELRQYASERYNGRKGQGGIDIFA